MNISNDTPKIKQEVNSKIFLIILATLISFTIMGIPISLGILIYLALKDIKNIRTRENCIELQNLILAQENEKTGQIVVRNLMIQKNEILSNPKMKEYNEKDQNLKQIIDSIEKIKLNIFNETQSDFDLDDEIEFKFNTSDEYKNEISAIKEKETDLKKTGAFNIINSLSVENSAKKGEKLQLKVGKDLATNFINEINLLIKNYKKSCFTKTSIDNLLSKIELIFNELNKCNEKVSVVLTSNILELEKQKFLYNVHYELLLVEEKEQAREKREQEKEEEKARKEIEKLKMKNEAEEKKAISNLEEFKSKLENASESQREEIEKNIANWEKIVEQIKIDKVNIEEFAKNYNVGYVYVVSNEESFKDDMLKIGMTRRPEPEKRFKELSNASVPFNFNPKILMKSENAYRLEKELHNRFGKRRVNKINKRKEFFYVSLEDIKNELNAVDISFEEHTI